VKKWSEKALHYMVKRRASGIKLTANQSVRRVMRWKSDSYRKRVIKGVHKLLYGWSDTSSSEEEQNKEDDSIKPQYESNLYDEDKQDEYQSDGWIKKARVKTTRAMGQVITRIVMR
jgi:hypothetical protein